MPTGKPWTPDGHLSVLTLPASTGEGAWERRTSKPSHSFLVSRVRPRQLICQRLNIITALTASLDAKELALHAYKLEYIKPGLIETPPIRSKTPITFYNCLHSSNYIKIFICTLHDRFKRFIRNI